LKKYQKYRSVIMNDMAIMAVPKTIPTSVNWIMGEQDGEQSKHTFISVERVTEILAAVQKAGISKTDFINRSILFGYEEALKALDDERKQHVSAIAPSAAKRGNHSRK